jgi:hypothetical protein
MMPAREQQENLVARKFIAPSNQGTNLKFEYRNPKQTNVQISPKSEKSKNPNRRKLVWNLHIWVI